MPFPDFSSFNFAPVIQHGGEWYVFDLTEKYDPEFIAEKTWGIGRYDEKRSAMYLAPQYRGGRNIHMGIDFWAPAGEPVYAICNGGIAYFEDHNQEGNYGPTIITRHELGTDTLFCLYGHLSRGSLKGLSKGQAIRKGEKIGEIGSSKVNGGWVPHLHFQISTVDPGQADMPGVVSEDNHQEALEKYPDPRLIVGEVY